MQKKVIKDISSIIERLGYEAIDIPLYADTGHISIQYPDWVGEIGGVKYTFNNCGFASQMKLWIQINKVNILSQPPRTNYYDFLIDYTDFDGYENFRNILENEIGLIKKA
jgi:hypothetical protein